MEFSEVHYESVMHPCDITLEDLQVCFRIVITGEKQKYDFTIEDGVMVPFSLAGDFFTIHSLSFEEFLEYIGKKPSNHFTSTLYLYHPIRDNVKKITTIDYTKVVDYLVSKNKLKTKPSKSFMAIDPRLFFLDGNWYQVDYLGTDLGKNVTEKIMSMLV